MSKNFLDPKIIFQEEIKNQINNISNNIAIDFDIPLNLNLNIIKELNNKCAALISEEKIEESLKILKKIELFLESNIMDQKLNFNKKLLIIILHNISCCYQKIKEIDNCISYLESVIYHYDLSLEKKHNIKINENYLIQHIKENKDNYQLLGDLILELRYSAKFHLQMSAILSEANRYVDALKHAKLASIICEDNLVKTYYLYFQIRDKQVKNGIIFNNRNNNNININEEDNILLNDKIKLNYKIINELYNIIINLRNYDDTKNKINSFPNKMLAFKSENSYENKKNKNNNFNSYLDYRTFEINKYNTKNSLINKIRYIFWGTIKQDDWIQLLNIENILYLSPLNCEDLDLDSDSRFELLKDTILEKIVMLTVSYFCISKEMKTLSIDKNNKKTNGEYYLYHAINFSSHFFPASCPILNNYISYYYKNYGQNMEIIPEGKIIDLKVNLIRNELEQNKETLSFIKLNKINYSNKIINNNDYLSNKNSKSNTVFKNINYNNILIPRLNIIRNDNKINIINMNNEKSINFTDANNNSNLNTNSNRNNNIQIEKKKKIYKSYEKKKKSIPKKVKKNVNNKPLSSNSVNMNNSNSNKKSKTMKFIKSFHNNNSKSRSHSKNNNNNKNESDIKSKYKNTMKINLNLNIKNNFDLLPNKNFLNFAKKSKINEKLAPKFKLNFAKLNKSDHESDDNDNNEIIYNFNSINKLITKSNKISKKNTELNIDNERDKKNKVNKKALSIHLNKNFLYLNGRDIKTERIKNPKFEIETNLYNKNIKLNKNKNKNNRNPGKNNNIYLSPKNNYASLLMKKKEFKGNKTERVLNKNKLRIKNNNNKINDIRIKFKSPQSKNTTSKTCRYFKFDKNNIKNGEHIFGNISFANKNKKANHINSIRYQYVNCTQKQKQRQKPSKSYYNNSNNSNSGNKDSMIKSMEIINKFFFNKNKKNNCSSENISFQKQPFKNKINLNKHHLNNNLISHFKNMKF